MSPLRRLKARLGSYPVFQEEKEPPGFFQFALDPQGVIRDFTMEGFTLVDTKAMDGIKGFKSEVLVFRSSLQKLYDYREPSKMIAASRFVISWCLAQLSGHIILLVLRREKSK
jgi:hypothetical protein